MPFLETRDAEVAACADCAARLARGEPTPLYNVFGGLPLTLVCEHGHREYGAAHEAYSDLMSAPCQCSHVRGAHDHGQVAADSPVTVGRCRLCPCTVYVANGVSRG